MLNSYVQESDKDSNKIKLHLGCGYTKKDGYINIDIDPLVNPDIVHDLQKPLPFDDNSVDEILAENIITLFTKSEWKTIKHDWFRVLKPGGKLDLLCIDIVEAAFWFIRFCEHRDGHGLNLFYGGQRNDHDVIKSGYYYDLLVDQLSEAGFTAHLRRSMDGDMELRMWSYKDEHYIP